MFIEKKPLPTAAPESLGLSSRNILKWIRKCDELGLIAHGFMILRHGQTAAEGYYAPVQRQWRHRLYSTSKSFCAIAIGMLQDEGKISLEDKIVDYFPEKCPDGDPTKVHPYIAATTIRDMLMMATPFSGSSYHLVKPARKDWVSTFFDAPVCKEPGTSFAYDTSSPTVLSALVEKLSGTDIMTYLYEHGFREMGLQPDNACVKTPDGTVSWAGSGMLVRLVDLAKAALMTMNYGKYDGKQIVSETYMREATSRQIDNGSYGYGYQIWQNKHGFGFSGMGGQMAYMMPDKDLILVLNGDTQSTPGILEKAEDAFYDLVWETAADEPLPADPEAEKELADQLKTLAIHPVQGLYESPLTESISGKTYTLCPNAEGAPASLKLSSARFDFSGDEGCMTLVDPEGTVTALRFGLGHFVYQNFPNFQEKDEVEGKPVIAYGFCEKTPTFLPCHISAAWKSDHELLITCYAIGFYVGTLKFRVTFTEDHITIFAQPFAERLWTEFAGFISGKC